MKLPHRKTTIARTIYNGQKDDEGRPHGHGVMEYHTSSTKKYKYEGHFVHGVRSGYGEWYELNRYIQEYEPWEWAQMGEFQPQWDRDEQTSLPDQTYGIQIPVK